MLAQLEHVPAGTVKDVLLIVIALGGFVMFTVSFVERRKAQKREVVFSAEYAIKDDFDRHVDMNADEHAQLFSKIGGVERGAMAVLDKKIEESRRERREDLHQLHLEISEVGKKVAGLETATALQNQTLAQLNRKLDRIAERQA